MTKPSTVVVPKQTQPKKMQDVASTGQGVFSVNLSRIEAEEFRTC